MSYLYSKVPISKLDTFDILTMKQDAIQNGFFPDAFEDIKGKLKYFKKHLRRVNQNHYFVLFLHNYKGWIIIKEDFLLKEIFIEYVLIFPQYQKQGLFKSCIRTLKKGGYTITLEAGTKKMEKVMKHMDFIKLEIPRHYLPVYRNTIYVSYKQVLMRQELK